MVTVTEGLQCVTIRRSKVFGIEVYGVVSVDVAMPERRASPSAGSRTFTRKFVSPGAGMAPCGYQRPGLVEISAPVKANGVVSARNESVLLEVRLNHKSLL